MTQLEWFVDPDTPRSGVSKGHLAWCACGWREFSTTTGTKSSETSLVFHKQNRCPLPRPQQAEPSPYLSERPTVDVPPSREIA